MKSKGDNCSSTERRLIQEASRQKLCIDKLDDVFNSPIIQLKVRVILGPGFCDYIGISHVANARGNTECVFLDTAAQKCAFRNCVLKMIGSHKSQDNEMNRRALDRLTPSDHTITQIIAVLKNVPEWRGMETDASWFRARLGTLKPPKITHEMIDTACNIYGRIVLIGLSSKRKNCFYKSYYAWRIFSSLGVSLEGWFKMPAKRLLETYRAEYDSLIAEQRDST